MSVKCTVFLFPEKKHIFYNNQIWLGEFNSYINFNPKCVLIEYAIKNMSLIFGEFRMNHAL